MNKIFIIASAFLLLVMAACERNEDIETTQVKLGSPIQFDFSLPMGEDLTRATLATDKIIFVTPDEGRNTWYAYSYNNTTHLWQAVKVYTYNSTSDKWEVNTSTNGITWTASTMLLYAVVRNDSHPTDEEEENGDSPLSTPITINYDQSTLAKLDACNVYGMVDRVSYTTGRVNMHLKHVMGKILLKVSNCPTPSAWSCETTKEGVSISRGIVARYYTEGKLHIGEDRIYFTDLANSVNIKLCRQNDNATNQTTEFVAYLLPSDEPIVAAFTLTNGEVTNTVTTKTDGGVTLLEGYTTTINCTLILSKPSTSRKKIKKKNEH